MDLFPNHGDRYHSYWYHPHCFWGPWHHYYNFVVGMELFHRKSKLLPGEADTASQVTLNIPDNRLWEWLRSWGPQELGDCRKHSELHACSSLAWASSTGVFLVQCTVDDHESVIAMIPWRKKYLVQAKLEIHTRLRALNWTRWHQLWFDFLGGIRIPLQKLVCA